MTAGVRRRGFLIGLLLVAAGAAAGLARWLGRPKPAAAPAPALANPTPIPASRTFLLSVADVIVPRLGKHPAASEVDLLPLLADSLARSPVHTRFFRHAWPRFQAELRRRVPVRDDRVDPAQAEPVFESWYREYRESPEPSLEARCFELYRYYVLRTYYATPEGWAAVGYTGPVHRPHPIAGSPS